MLFNSYGFIFFFLPVIFILYFTLSRKGLSAISKGTLVLSSLLFYSWWNVAYLPIIITSMVFNYSMGVGLGKDGDGKYLKKLLLIFSIISNISLLGYFKYMDFLINNINLVSGSDFDLLNLTLPLAISFFTFQQIAYLVDSYKQETKEHSFLNYSLFVTFFPQLIAGPIVHHSEMIPQFTTNKKNRPNTKNISMGLFIFSIGLFKKTVIADSFSVWATQGFDVAYTLNFFEAWVTSISYTLQLYFDFSGYTDMAVGIALLFNIKLPINFNSPYKSTNIQDFWRRWHITLSRFLRDYVYIPLGGNRNGGFRVHTNIIATFLLGGIWHGAGWTFIFWGLLHGVGLTTQRVWCTLEIKVWKWLAWLITFNFINIAWIFFRAKEWGDAIKVLNGMISIESITLPLFLAKSLNLPYPHEPWLGAVNGNVVTPLWIMAGILLTVCFKNTTELCTLYAQDCRGAIFTGVCFSYCLLTLSYDSEFLYFNF